MFYIRIGLRFLYNWSHTFQNNILCMNFDTRESTRYHIHFCIQLCNHNYKPKSTPTCIP